MPGDFSPGLFDPDTADPLKSIQQRQPASSELPLWHQYRFQEHASLMAVRNGS